MNFGLNIIDVGLERPRMYAMVGGPVSRLRTEPIKSSILGKGDGFVRCPRVIRLGLLFGEGDDPVTVLMNILAEEGYAGPEALRGAFELPGTRLICRTLLPARDLLSVRTAPRRKILKQALMLGLCTNQIFDPGRPVLWTTTSLTRALELFDHRVFYA